MNIRQRKKQFKKRFGFNPPRNVSVQRATKLMAHKENIIALAEKMKKAALDLWDWAQKAALELAEALKKIGTALLTEAEKRRRQCAALADFQTKILVQQRKQEREAVE